jgi:DNA polymerase III subunit delta
MITTLNGENSFGLQRRARHIVDAFVAEHGDLALERLDGQEASVERIGEALRSLPFLSPKKLVVLREPGSNKQFAEQIEQLLQEVPDTTEVLIIEPKLDKRLSYYKFLKKHTQFEEFAQLDQNGLARWLVDAAKEQGGSLAANDARYMVERVGANQQLLAQELEKLLLFSATIKRQSIDLLTEATPQSTIFQLLEAAFAGKSKQALALYREQRALKVEPQQIIAMLAWQLHVLALLKTAGDRPVETIAKEAKLNPFVVRKSQGIARQLSMSELNRLVTDLLLIDRQMKSTSLDPDEALQHYLLQLAA